MEWEKQRELIRKRKNCAWRKRNTKKRDTEKRRNEIIRKPPYEWEKMGEIVKRKRKGNLEKVEMPFEFERHHR